VALAAAPNTTEVLVPAATPKGLAGFDVTPLGSPLRAICTVPLNPFAPLIETLMGVLVAPWVTLREFTERRTEKSCGAGGGGWTLAVPPPQPAHISNAVVMSISGTHRLDRPIERPRIHSARLTKTCLTMHEMGRRQGI